MTLQEIKQTRQLERDMRRLAVIAQKLAEKHGLAYVDAVYINECALTMYRKDGEDSVEHVLIHKTEGFRVT